MKVCFVSHSAGRYGAELALLELLQGLIKLGIECLVILPKEGPLLGELKRLNIEFRVIHYPVWLSRPNRALIYRIRRTFRLLFAATRLSRVIMKSGCDVVYTNTGTIGAGAIGAWLAGTPHVWHLHESARHNPTEQFHLGERFVTYLMDRLSERIIVTSYSLMDDFVHRMDANKLRVIYQSVTLREETSAHLTPYDEQAFRCIIVGSLHPRKGQDEAIAALSEVVRRGMNVHLLIVGDEGKHFQPQLLRDIKRFDLEERVTFRGYAKNPVPLIRASDAVLVCSQWEAFGRVAVEAMLAGTPVIGSNRGATPELIQDGETGLLYEFGNSAQLADKIQFLLDNPKERARIGVQAKQWAKARFTQERYAREVFDVLSDLVPGHVDSKTNSSLPNQMIDDVTQSLTAERKSS